jgi:alanyl aminopeptidase
MLRPAHRLILPSVLVALAACVLVGTGAAKEVRLDLNVVPTFQAVELDLDANRTEYTGSVKIELSVQKPTRSFLFHAHEMSLGEVALRNKNGSIDIETEMNGEGLVTAKTGQLEPGRYTLEISFSKDYNTKAVGLYRMEYDGQGYLFSQFQALDARRAFPCWDEPIVKIPYQITVTIPEGQEVVTNTPVEADDATGGTRRVVFQRTKPMPSYLLAIAAGPLESAEITGLSVPGRVYTPAGQSQLTGLAVEMTPGILAACEEYFGREYPYEKLDLIAIPEYWPGAMENPGAVTYADGILLVDPDAASVRQRQLLAYVTAHELAHMWFGDLVTMSWWDDLWLNESFADWLGEKVAHNLYPEYEIELEELGDLQNLMSGDARPSTTPVRKPVVTASDIFEDLGLAYGKGRTILRMVEEWVGPETFQQGVRTYIEQHAWGSTVAADLFAALSDAAGRDLRDVFSSFLDQPGYPLITLSAGSGGKISLSQRRFLNHGAKADNYTWDVPIRLKYFDGSETHIKTLLLDKTETTIDLGGDVVWALPDAGAYGYYRWSLPEDMLLRIAENPEHTLDARERAVFLSNLKSLLNAGEIAGDEYLRALGSLAGVPRPEIIDAVISNLGAVEDAFVTPELERAFAEYVKMTLRPALDTFGMQKRDGEAASISLLRPRLLWWVGGRGEDDEVRAYCKSIAEKYMNDHASVDPSIASAALRVAMVDAGDAEFEACKTHFQDARVPAVRSAYLFALGSFNDTAIQDKALAYVLSGQLRANELFSIPQQVSNTAAGRERAWQWLQGNYEDMTSRIPPEYAAFMPYMASGCDAGMLKEAREFFAKPEHNVDGTDKNLNKVADSTINCVNLREREGATVADFLNQLLAGQ